MFVDRVEIHDFPPDFEEQYDDRFHDIPDELLSWYERAYDDLHEAEEAIREKISEEQRNRIERLRL